MAEKKLNVHQIKPKKQNAEKSLSAIDALSEEEQNEIRETFNLFDRDNDGYLTAKELGESLRAMAQHPTEQEVKDLARRATSEGEKDNDLTDFNGFLTIMAKRMSAPEPDDQLLEAFRIFDKEGTGVISAADLRQYMTCFGEKLTDEEVEEMIREADEDGDGQINCAEFTSLLLSK